MQSTELTQDIWMLLSLLLSVGIGAHKMAKVTKLRDLWKEKQKYQDAIEAHKLKNKDMADGEPGDKPDGANKLKNKEELDGEQKSSDVVSKSSDASQSQDCVPKSSDTSQPRNYVRKSSKAPQQLPAEKKAIPPLLKALPLSLDAHSLDEFLTLIRLDQYKNDILNLGAGATTMELSNSGYDKHMFFDAIESMTRTQASRLAKQLSKYKKKRDKEKNEKALHVSVGEQDLRR